MSKHIILFVISLIFGFTVLILRNYYENKTGEIKSHWNVAQLEEGDSKNFFDRGLALSQGKSFSYGYESAPVVAYARTPVYSIFLAFSFLVFGTSLKAVILMQIIIASIIVCLISTITKLIFENNIICWISGFLAILYYPMWNNAVQINCELIATLIGLFALYYILKFYITQENILRNLLLSGIYVGLAALTRGQFFYYSFLYLIFIFSISNYPRKTKVKYSLFWFSFVIIPILLWSVYAYFSSDIFIFISSQGAFMVWWGWSPAVVIQEKYPMWNPLWDSDKNVKSNDLHALYISSKSSFWFLKEAIKFIYMYPVDSFKIACFKLLESWGLQEFYLGQNFLVKIFKAFKYNWDFLFAIYGWIILWKQKINKVFCQYTFYALLIYIFVSLVTGGVIRYRVPFLDPLFIILASYSIFKIYSRFILKKSN
jgi:4-amino-4-deoxy-L-arabinose transferase-like glycosyltransferase